MGDIQWYSCVLQKFVPRTMKVLGPRAADRFFVRRDYLAFPQQNKSGLLYFLSSRPSVLPLFPFLRAVLVALASSAKKQANIVWQKEKKNLKKQEKSRERSRRDPGDDPDSGNKVRPLTTLRRETATTETPSHPTTRPW